MGTTPESSAAGEFSTNSFMAAASSTGLSGFVKDTEPNFICDEPLLYCSGTVCKRDLSLPALCVWPPFVFKERDAGKKGMVTGLQAQRQEAPQPAKPNNDGANPSGLSLSLFHSLSPSASCHPSSGLAAL